jgi:molecular chaperone Hsp33
MSHFDRLERFYFEELGIRGELVRLEDAWASSRGTTDYPDIVQSQLGQALAAVLLLSGTIKYQGSLILQVQGAGPISTLVAQATHVRTIRGLAHWADTPAGETLSKLYGDARLVLTIQNQGQGPYQGIVALDGDSLSQAIESYFNLSEQLPTRLWLVADEQRAGGLFIRSLPAHEEECEDWNTVIHLASTITENELLNLPSHEVLFRLFHEERVRLLDPEPVSFRCRCAQDRIEGILLAMGEEEIATLLEKEGHVEVSCDFCNRHYIFDCIDIAAMFSRSFRLAIPRLQQ